MKKTTLAQPVPQLPVADVEKAQIYYRDILGFEITWSTPDMGVGAVAREEVGIFFARVKGPIEPNFHWIFAENVDEAYAELMNSGADIIEPIENKPWKTRQFAIRDLNGHIFYIHHGPIDE